MLQNRINTFEHSKKDKHVKEKSSLFLYVACAYIFMVVGRIQELVPFLSQLYLMKIIGALSVIALFLSRNSLKNMGKRIKASQVKCLLGLLVLAVISIPFAVWPGGSFNFLITYYWKTLLLFVLILGLVVSMKDVDRVIWAFLIAIFLLGVFSIASDIQGIAFAKERVYVTETYDANDLAMVMIVAFPFAVFWFLNRKGLIRLICGGLTALIIVTIILTASRGGFVGFLGVSLAILLRARKILRKAFVPLIIITILGSGVFVFYAKSSFRERMSTLLTYEQDYNVTAYSGRIEIWKRGLKIMAEHPIFGVGIDGFTTAEGLSHKDVGGKWSTAHNSFIQIGAELGVVGLILFCYIIWTSLKGMRKVLKSVSQEKDAYPILTTLYAIQCSWIGYAVGGFFLSAAHSPLFFLLVGLSTVIPFLIMDMEIANLLTPKSRAMQLSLQKHSRGRMGKFKGLGFHD
jgi:O-antigen ligase